METKDLLQKYRIQKKMTQKDIAESIGISESAVQKWESGKNTVRLPEAISLCRVLGIQLEQLCPEVKEVSGGQKVMLVQLKEVNPSAAKEIEYYGLEETVAGFKSYFSDYENAVERHAMSSGDVAMTWDEENHFTVLVDTDTDEINGMRDFGKYLIDGSDFLLCSKYVPVRIPQPGSAEYIKDYALKTKQILTEAVDEAINDAKKKGKRPVFLIRGCGENNYLAWSIEEKKHIYIYDYKKYRTTFYFSEVTDNISETEIIQNMNYEIYTPTQEIIDRCDLLCLLYPNVWENKMAWDEWEERPEWITKILNYEEYTDSYTDAIGLLNMARKKDLGLDDLFWRLESRIGRFERLDELGAPKVIVDGEAKMFRDTFAEIKDKLGMR